MRRVELIVRAGRAPNVDTTMSDRTPEIRFPIPFWSWNDRLDAQELRHQVREMARQSVGGFFMHARGGLRTDYLSDEWFAAIRAATREAVELGLEPWLYDENGWPSGFAEGRVPALGEEFRQKYLRLGESTIGEAIADDAVIAWYDPRTLERIVTDPADRERVVLVARFETNEYYVDTLTRAVTDAFIDATHEVCAARLSGEEFAAVRGFFTDEPQISRSGHPWSPTIVSEYARRYDDDLLDHLPALFHRLPGFERVRYRYWMTVTRLFAENFLRPIAAWCDAHGKELTGHLVEEETYATQCASNGAVMGHYEYFHLPGMDWLGRGIGPVTTPVQVSSVASQLGKPGVLSETFALCGWHMSFEEMRRIFQWQMVHGVTLLCPHLQAYSLRGLRKRDYPPSIFVQQPWWDDYASFTRTVSIVGSTLGSGRHACDVLVLHGQRSAWLEFDAGSNGEIASLFARLLEISDALDRAFVPFHYGDETIIERHGDVDGGAFVVGRDRYRVVILPPVLVLGARTALLLERFAAQGGVVLRCNGESPLVDGAPAPVFAACWNRFSVFSDARALVAAAAPASAEQLPFDPVDPQHERGPDDALYATARRGVSIEGVRGTLFYLVSTAREKRMLRHRVDAAEPDALPVRLLVDVDAGALVRAESDISETEYAFAIEPGGDALFFLADEAAERARFSPSRPTPAAPAGATEIALPARWRVETATPNVVTLDRCDWWVDGEPAGRGEAVANILDRLLALGRDVDLRMEFAFEAREPAAYAASCELLVEDPELWAIEVNGEAVRGGSRWRFDRSFRSIAIGERLRDGANTVVMSSRVGQSRQTLERLARAWSFEAEKNKLTFDREIESIYLVGDFGVDATDAAFEPLTRGAERFDPGRAIEVGPRPAYVRIGSVHRDGFAFFAGEISLVATVELAKRAARLELECTGFGANSLALAVDGTPAGTIFWRPYRLVADGPFAAGTHELRLTLRTSLRNMLGPHHMPEGECAFVGPFSFFSRDGIFARTWSDELNGWNDAYALQRLGVDEVRLRALS